MGRKTQRQKSYGHRVDRLDVNSYRVQWTVDRFFENSRLRYPTGYSRVTDRAGAVRFAKKHDVVVLHSDLATKEE